MNNQRKEQTKKKKKSVKERIRIATEAIKEIRTDPEAMKKVREMIK